MIGTYIHIPFCDAICIYCNFAKEIANDDKKRAYLKALFHEMSLTKEWFKQSKTIYIGGGTPTALPDDAFEALLQEINHWVDMAQITEFTVEANPDNLTDTKLSLMKTYGVNRISLGIQTTQDHLLKTINRTHTYEGAKRAVKKIKANGFDNFSVDIIFSLPGQTMEELKDDIRKMLDMDPPHIALYSLILEDHTPLKHLINIGKLKMLDQDTEASMYETVIQSFLEAGYEHYEISNFSKPGKRSIHNQIYWKNDPYLGLGAGAHGRLDSYRYQNLRSVKKYTDTMLEKGLKVREIYPYQAIHDTLLMGLRMKDGVDLIKFEKRFNIDVFQRFKGLERSLEDGLIEVVNNYLKLTERGFYLANEVLIHFIESDDETTA